MGYSPCGRKESDTTERLHFTLLHFGLLITSILTVVKVLLRDTGFLTAGSA